MTNFRVTAYVAPSGLGLGDFQEGRKQGPWRGRSRQALADKENELGPREAGALGSGPSSV